MSSFGYWTFTRSCVFFLIAELACGSISLMLRDGRYLPARITLLTLMTAFQYLNRILIHGNVDAYMIIALITTAFLSIASPIKLISALPLTGYVISFFLPVPASFFVSNYPGLSENTMIFIPAIITGLSILTARVMIYSQDLLITDLIKERETNKSLIEFNVQLQNFAKEREIRSAQEERNRITREMHDANGYHFTNIIALLNAAISSGNKEWTTIEDILQLASNEARKGLVDSRKILHEIRASFSHEALRDLYGEVHYIADIFRKCTGVDVVMNWGNLSPRYDKSVMMIISRIIQEALVNSVKHGQATKVEISFWESNDELTFFIEDNGIGSTQIVKGIGLTGMEERIRPFNGRLSYTSYPGAGFKLIITLPISNTKE